MERALRQTVVIGPGGTFEGRVPGIAPGTSAEVIVLFEETEGIEASAPDRQSSLARAWAISDKAIADGMETWDIDRVNAEIHERRYGDRERS